MTDTDHTLQSHGDMQESQAEQRPLEVLHAARPANLPPQGRSTRPARLVLPVHLQRRTTVVPYQLPVTMAYDVIDLWDDGYESLEAFIEAAVVDGSHLARTRLDLLGTFTVLWEDEGDDEN